MNTGNKDIATIVGAALEIASAPEREAYLARECAGVPGLRHRIDQLLRDHAQAGDFLEQPAVVSQTIDMPTVAGSPGTVIGPYKVVEQIGEGGFGVVFMAEQTKPVRRKVALKMLKPGMDTGQVVARFEADRQRSAVILQQLQQQSYAEIAIELQLSHRSVKRHVARARRNLQRLLIAETIQD